MASRRELPYTTIAAVVPCPAGWLVLPGRLQGVTLIAEPPFTAREIVDVLDHRPSFEAISLAAPVGFPDVPRDGRRACDDDVRGVLGWPRRAAVANVPSRAALAAATFDEAKAIEPWLTRLQYRHFPRWREIDREIQMFHQRSVYSALPEVCFQMLNDDQPLDTSPHSEVGLAERLALAETKVPGIERIIADTKLPGVGMRHLVEAAALLWTARRIAGRVVNRFPQDPEWNDAGLRLELVR
jgi:predicted RNase H-like nuclease